MSWLGKLDRLTDAQVRQVAYFLADCAERAEPVTEARMDQWVARFAGPVCGGVTQPADRCICHGSDVCLGVPGESDACGACLESTEGCIAPGVVFPARTQSGDQS